MAQDGPRWLQDGPRWPRDGLKMASRWPKMASRLHRMASRWPKMASRWPQDGTKIAPHEPQANQPTTQPARPNLPNLQDGFKKHPRCVPKANTNMHVCMFVSWGLSWAQGLLQHDLDDPKLAQMTYMIASRSLPNAPRWPPKAIKAKCNAKGFTNPNASPT